MTKRVARVSAGFSLPLWFLTSWAAGAATQDPFSWLNDIKGERPLAWVAQQNQQTLQALQGDRRFERYRQIALDVINGESKKTSSSEPIRFFTQHGRWIYTLQQNEAHPRGMWRRTPASAYLNNTPEWEDLLDIDAMSEKEGKPWIMMLRSDTCWDARCLLTFVEGGESALPVIREYDVELRKFIDGGFSGAFPPGTFLQGIWKDRNTLLAMVVRGVPPDRVAQAGDYVIVEWRRGQPLSSAKAILQPKDGEEIDALTEYEDKTGARSSIAMVRKKFDGAQARVEYWEVGRGQPMRLNIPPAAAVVARYSGQWIIMFLQDWTSGQRVWKASSYASIPHARIFSAHPSMLPIFEPKQGIYLPMMQATDSGLLATAYENVRAQVWRFTYRQGQWVRDRLPLPDQGTITVQGTQPNASEAIAMYEDVLVPPTTYRLDVAGLKAMVLTKAPADFNTAGDVTEQFWAVSRDGTRVPYFIVRPKNLAYDGKAPTLMHSYGNGAPSIPTYDGILGRLWLEQGGVYVIANIRGGRDLGLEWALTRLGRQHTYEDFIAVAEDLIRRKVTSPEHLGIHGHSWGGQLVGAVLNQRPDLFNAGVMQNPVLDELDNGSIRNGERVNLAYTADAIQLWGSLDVPEERAFLERTSAYQNLKPRNHFPIPLVATTTTDPHSPDMARRYCAKAQSLGLPCHFYEYPEGGHGMNASAEQFAHWNALFYVYLSQRLMQ